ncbi:zinc-binding metallopeptidase family protein [Litorisediminicola beolgyonensis]|uniref:Zinc-binding metallopeptidase n=1 Tax=Litorisediminicola beolgyonensis TaxID=1173614 RepID=A0ABW3ZHZ4_9RHOB
MQVFTCPLCAADLYFHNTVCNCGHEIVFNPGSQTMIAATDTCANRDRIGCNWRTEGDALCRACETTETVPDLGASENLGRWRETEQVKRRMFANLARWGWFTPGDPGARPVFRLLSEETASGAAQVTMGHADGLITINVSEADEATRAQRQEDMGELYRTMLGHLRHETAHFLFVRLSEQPEFLDAFRALFGDEREDYGAALKAHYADPDAPGSDHVSSYATAHPHEDWAETVAHLLHLVDLLDSAVAVSIAGPDLPGPGYDAYADSDTDALIERAISVSIAVNHVNRALDLPDLYPFVLRDGVRTKLAFAHRWLRHGPESGLSPAA